MTAATATARSTGVVGRGARRGRGVAAPSRPCAAPTPARTTTTTAAAATHSCTAGGAGCAPTPSPRGAGGAPMRRASALLLSHRARPASAAPPRASPGGSGSLWDSNVVQKEFDVLMRDFRDLMTLQRKFPDFDPDGKAIYLDRLDDLADRLNIFVTRMRLADDGVAKVWLRDLNVQLLEAGLTVDTLQAGLKASTDSMRAWVAAEAAAGTDPAASAAAKARLKAQFAAAPDVGALLSDPALAAALADPRVLAAVKAAVAGGPGAAAEYLDDPVVGPVLRKLFEQQRGKGGGGAVG